MRARVPCRFRVSSAKHRGHRGRPRSDSIKVLVAYSTPRRRQTKEMRNFMRENAHVMINLPNRAGISALGIKKTM